MTAEPPSQDELHHVADPGALLPGEDPRSTFLEDAVHWVRVYSELLELKLALLRRADDVLAGASDDAMREANIDDRLLRAEADRYALRHRYWTQRVNEFAAAAPGGESDPTRGRPHG
jgi:hypothetical protein